jgi:hypothetical protein
VATKYLQTPLLKQSAKDYFFKAVLSYLTIGDMVGAKNCLGNAGIEDPGFEQSRQYTFLEAVFDSIEASDSNMFITAVQSHNKIMPMDKVLNSLVAQVRMENL